MRLAMMSRDSHMPTSRVTACNRAPSGACTKHRNIRCRLSAGTVQTHPGHDAVVVRGKRAPAELCRPVQAQAVPRTDEGPAVHLAGGELGAQVWACAGPDMQRAMLSAPGDDFDTRDRGADRSCADAFGCGERVPVAARPVLRPLHGGVDNRRGGLTVRRPLSRPSSAGKQLKRCCFGQSRSEIGQLGHV
jgi:hypothetical protein